jgi:hypothetical protein
MDARSIQSAAAVADREHELREHGGFEGTLARSALSLDNEVP